MKYTVMQWFAALIQRDYCFFKEDTTVNWSMFDRILNEQKKFRAGNSDDAGRK